MTVRQRLPGFHAAGLRRAALAVLTAAGCAGSDTVAPPRDDIGGAYTLRTVGSDTLPATVFDSTYTDAGVRVTIAITGGSMTLSSAGGYLFFMTYTFTVNGYLQPVVPLGDRGTYERSGSTLTFSSGDGQSTMSGTLAGGQLTMAQDLLDDGVPLSLLYRK